MKFLFIFFLLLPSSLLFSITASWNDINGGSWNDPTNWTPNTVPNGVDDVAIFPIEPAPFTPIVITLDPGNKTVGTLQFDFEGYTISGTSLTFQTSGGPAQLIDNAPVTDFNISLAIQNIILNSDLEISSSGRVIVFDGSIQGANDVTMSSTAGSTISYIGFVDNTYTGLTTVNNNAILQLNKGGFRAIAGDLLVNSGGQVEVQFAGNEFAPTTTITIESGGSLTVSSEFPASLEFGRLVLNGGVFDSTATLLSSSNALTISGSTFPGGSIPNGGSVVHDPTFGPSQIGSSFEQVELALGATTTTFDIGEGGLGGSDLTVYDFITSTGGGITKIGNGILEFTGDFANTYSGLTTVSAGRLLLNKPAGVDAIGGDLLIDGTGVVTTLAAEQIPDTAVVTINSGTFNMNFSETISRLIYNGGTLNQDFGAVLSLADSVAPLTMRDTVIGGNVNLLAGGTVTFDATNNGTAVIIGNLDLGAATTFDIGNGTEPIDMLISGAITGIGPVTKIGPGTLEFFGITPNTYTGDTLVSAGTLNLNKSENVNAIPGDLTIDGGTVTLFASEQIEDTATVTINSGTFDMGAFSETISSLVFNGGTLTQAGGTLNLGSDVTALTMRNTTISGPVSILNGGDVVFDATNNGTATISGPLNLNEITTFNIANGSAAIDMLISGPISGTGGVIKTGLGTLAFSGTTANTYSDTTTVSQGTLFLNKTPGVNAIPGDILINVGGTLTLGASEQIANSSDVILDFGTFDMATFSETINSLTFNGGTLAQSGSSVLSLASSGIALTMFGDTTIEGGLSLLNGGTVVFNPIRNGTATISGPLDLGAITPTFDIGDGIANPDMLLSGPITSSGAGLTKIGEGTLEISGTATIDGVTTIEEGTLAVSGTLQGAGDLIIGPGAFLTDTGPIIKDILVEGTVNPGRGFGTITIIGDVIFAPGSTLMIELTPTVNDFVDITGTMTIQPGATLNVDPVPATYIASNVYHIVTTTGGVFGTFSTVTSTYPLFHPVAIYTATDIFIQEEFLPFSALIHGGNAGAVAHCLDELPSPTGSDLASVINSLRFLTSVTDIENALLQLQPSAFTSLAIAQETNFLYVKNNIFNVLEMPQHSCPGARYLPRYWVAPIMGTSDQFNRGEEPGYNSLSPGVVLGSNLFYPGNHFIGGAVGYTYTDLRWKKRRGRADINSFYAAVFGRAERNRGFVEASLIGAYNLYSTTRAIDIVSNEGTINRKARGNHHGFDGNLNLKGGLFFRYNGLLISPFVELNGMYLHESAFQERDANSLNLYVEDKNSTLLVSAAGLDLSGCVSRPYGRFTPFLQLAVMRESRYEGRRMEALMGGECTLEVIGLYPSRTLGAVVAGVNIPGFSFFYKGKYSSSFYDHSFNLDFAF